jgi:hypothetical protein
VLIRRTDDAHVGANRVGAADALKLAVLDHAQNLLLHARRYRAELVEDQRAAVGLLEAADVRARRPCEGPGLMTEQFRFEQRLREGGAVDLDQRLLPARREIVQARGDELFTRTALADNEHGFDELGSPRDVLEHGHESRCFANQADAFGGNRGSAGQGAPTVGRLGEILAQDQTRTQAFFARLRKKILRFQSARGQPSGWHGFCFEGRTHYLEGLVPWASSRASRTS